MGFSKTHISEVTVLRLSFALSISMQHSLCGQLLSNRLGRSET